MHEHNGNSLATYSGIHNKINHKESMRFFFIRLSTVKNWKHSMRMYTEIMIIHQNYEQLCSVLFCSVLSCCTIMRIFNHGAHTLMKLFLYFRINDYNDIPMKLGLSIREKQVNFSTLQKSYSYRLLHKTFDVKCFIPVFADDSLWNKTTHPKKL